MVWLSWVGVAAACEPITASAFVATLTEAESAFAALDIEGFLAQSEAAREQLPCLVDIAPPGLAAQIHRVEGLRAFGERSVDAVRYFAAARSIEPAYTFPVDVAPAGSPLLDDYFALNMESHQREPVPAASDGAVSFDGAAQSLRPTAWPTLFQWVDAGGVVRVTAYVRVGDVLPVYPALVPPVVSSSTGSNPPPTSSTVTRVRPAWPLAVGAGAAALGAAGLYAGAAGSRAAWSDPATPDARLDPLKHRTNALVVASGVSAVAAVGLGVGWAVSW